MFYKGEYSASRLAQAGRASNEKIQDRPGVYLPDFVKLAEAHGALGLRATTQDEAVRALEKAFETPGPVVVECAVRQEENVYPMVPPGASLTEMVHSMA